MRYLVEQWHHGAGKEGELIPLASLDPLGVLGPPGKVSNDMLGQAGEVLVGPGPLFQHGGAGGVSRGVDFKGLQRVLVEGPGPGCHRGVFGLPGKRQALEWLGMP